MSNKRLDLNALEQPTFELTLRDEAKTTVHLTLPEVKLIERLIAAAPELKEVQKTGEAHAIKAVYTLAADLLSNNEEGITFTAEELPGKYGVKYVYLIYIFRDYLDFVAEIQNAKN